MRLKQLEEFIAVVQTGSLRGAARALGITQPALTKAIRRLEEEVGAPLLVRTGRGVSLTEYGSALLPRAEAVQSELQRAAEDLDLLRGGAQRALSISVTPAVGTTIIPEALRQFRKSYPDVGVNLLDGLSPPGVSLLKIGAVDLYVGSAPGAQNDTGLNSIQLAPNEIAVACRPGHPLHKATRLSELVGADWVFTGPHGFRGDILNVAFEKQGLPPPLSKTNCASFTTLLSLAATSDLLVLVSRRVFHHGPFRDILVPLSLTDLNFEIAAIRAVWKASHQLTPVEKAFVASLRQAARNI